MSNRHSFEYVGQVDEQRWCGVSEMRFKGVNVASVSKFVSACNDIDTRSSTGTCRRPKLVDRLHVQDQTQPNAFVYTYTAQRALCTCLSTTTFSLTIHPPHSSDTP